MKLNLNDVAVYETRTVPEEAGSHFMKSVRGWWSITETFRRKLLGANRAKAEDTYAIHHVGEAISWTK